MSNKNLKSEERDEDGLTVDKRAIIDSIDYDRIISEVTAKQDEIVANAVKTAKKEARKTVGKTRRTGLCVLVIATLFLVTGFIALTIELGIYFLIASVLMYVFGGCLFLIARSNKRFSSET